ncbi:hypothetical protein Tco_1454496 [Tanacetum coccineum]
MCGRCLCSIRVEDIPLALATSLTVPFISSILIVLRRPVIFGNKESTDERLDDSSSSKFDALLEPYEEPDLMPFWHSRGWTDIFNMYIFTGDDVPWEVVHSLGRRVNNLLCLHFSRDGECYLGLVVTEEEKKIDSELTRFFNGGKDYGAKHVTQVQSCKDKPEFEAPLKAESSQAKVDECEELISQWVMLPLSQ